MAGTTRQIGDDVLLYINMGTDALPNYVIVRGQTDYSASASKNEVDVSAKGDAHDQIVPGSQSGEVSLTLMAERPGTADLTQAALRNSFNNRLAVVLHEVSTFPEAAADGSEDVTEVAEGYIMEYSKSASGTRRPRMT